MSTEAKQEVLELAADALTSQPYQTLTLEKVAEVVDLPYQVLAGRYATMHSLGSAILTHEGSTMRAAQQRAEETTAAPLERLQLAFRLVGRNLACDPIARAGIRIAAEAADCFPERKINPFRTWERFVLRNLEEARSLGHLRPGADINSVAWLFVAAGMGTKDLLGFTGEWSDAEEKLSTVAAIAIDSVRAR
ncbi:hypothetical protein [Brevibacterium aurantiacum]|uniref:CprB tetracyclin repressor-like C-terminal domain-containing protein n=1 Tax=Brevibacterium aurantiacum TaxID=273384 RepID=A0A2A3WZM3_BREAU|nr:hypothetical protein [Brevibacterium aurantiacum]PCC16878.1 hypothetical protein CIK79_00295 [Brevibacterium aurantiacum]